MSDAATMGLDPAKRVASLCGEDDCGRMAVQRTPRGATRSGCRSN